MPLFSQWLKFDDDIVSKVCMFLLEAYVFEHVILLLW